MIKKMIKITDQQKGAKQTYSYQGSKSTKAPILNGASKAEALEALFTKRNSCCQHIERLDDRSDGIQVLHHPDHRERVKIQQSKR